MKPIIGHRQIANRNLEIGNRFFHDLDFVNGIFEIDNRFFDPIKGLF